jgi:RHS repeat-associated protein|nr:MAG TPA: RHS repeat-associated core domain [Caudoviricetes sp.]
MIDKDGNLLWFGEYTTWGRLKEETRVTDSAYQPFRLQNQYANRETGLHYNFFRYYEPDAGRFVNQDPIGLEGGDKFYWFTPSVQAWGDPLGLATRPNNGKYHIFFDHKLDSGIRYSSDAVQFNDANKAFIKKMESNPSF